MIKLVKEELFTSCSVINYVLHTVMMMTQTTVQFAFTIRKEVVYVSLFYFTIRSLAIVPILWIKPELVCINRHCYSVLTQLWIGTVKSGIDIHWHDWATLCILLPQSALSKGFSNFQCVVKFHPCCQV